VRNPGGAPSAPDPGPWEEAPSTSLECATGAWGVVGCGLVTLWTAGDPEYVESSLRLMLDESIVVRDREEMKVYRQENENVLENQVKC